MNFQQSALTLAIGLAVSHATSASPIILDAFNDNSLPAGSNTSSPEVEIGFGINFFGETWERTFVNENGNITFLESFGGFARENLSYGEIGVSIIAPFFAQVESSNVTYGQGDFEGNSAFGVNWIDVSYFSVQGAGDNLNSFQLILVDRQNDPDGIAGDFDIVFNYGDIFWEAGDNQGGTGGLIDEDFSTDYDPPLAGFSNPWGLVSNTISTDTNIFELPGSGEAGAFLNDGPYELAFNNYNSDIEGRYIFEFRGDEDIFSVPEPATLLLLGSGLLGLSFARRRFHNS